MKLNNRFNLSAILLILFMMPLQYTFAENSMTHIVPLPLNIKALNEKPFTITSETPFVTKDANKLGLEKVEAFINRMNQLAFNTEAKLVKTNKLKNNSVIINYCDTLSKEAYILDVKTKNITISASSEAGVFYGLQTLQQYILNDGNKQSDGSYLLSAVHIYDKPYFGYRSMLLDVCRHFYNVDEVKTVIDIMAMHKLNTLHFHLTDDQGWRIQIDAYPLLTEIGSKRKETMVGHFPTPKGYPTLYDNTPYGGFYTKEQLKDIIAYAQQNFITIIPEIEIPGHSVAILASYPELGCKGKDYEVRTTWGVSHDLCCPGKAETFKFWETVLKEVSELFPGEYIHIGGDECPKDVWHTCPLCQEFMKKHNLANESELQGYISREMEKIIEKDGKKMIGWEEILSCGVTNNTTIMSWLGTKSGIAAAKKGNNVVMVPEKFCYFDYYQSENHDLEPLSIGGYISVEKAYSFDPLEGLNSSEQKHILGVQCNLWTEYITCLDHLQYMMLPRVAALSEIGWTYNNRNYNQFVERTLKLFNIYDLCGYKYATHIKLKKKQNNK